MNPADKASTLAEVELASPGTDRVADPYDLAALDTALAGTPFAGRLHHFAEIGSTNTHAMQQGAAGAPDGSVYFADAQTAGRGRGAHAWVSPPGSGLYVSVLLRPQLAPGDALWFSLAAGVAVQNAVRAVTDLAPDLRWPNDLLLGPDGKQRKFCGILTEMHAEVTRVRYIVIGIGINVHHREFPPELTHLATSLAIEGAACSRQALLVHMLAELHHGITALTTGDPAVVNAALRNRVEEQSTWMRGKRVTVDEGQAGNGTHFSGVTDGLDPRGFLKVRTADGVRTVLSGGVRAAVEIEEAPCS